MTNLKPQEVRHVPPSTSRGLWNRVYQYHGIRIANRPVCPEHQPPWEAFKTLYFDEPGEMLVLGPRGGGKSFLTAIETHQKSRHTPRYGTRVLGGSLAQSAQIRAAIQEGVLNGRGPFGWNDADQITRLTATQVHYRSGSEVQMLAAGDKAVRGPHVPALRLDEIDEMNPEIREAAIGIATEKAIKGWDPAGYWGETGQVLRSTICQTSTWHRSGGPMGQLIAKAKAANRAIPGSYPFFAFCSFDVLERCPESISGPNLELCPVCPLVKWCHNPGDGGMPLAKRGNGHYTIRSLQQKALAVSARIFAADYLCRGPRVEGLYFPTFDATPGGVHIPTGVDYLGRHPAEYDPSLGPDATWLAVDPGVQTGAVFFQRFGLPTGLGPVPAVRIFADYHSRRAEATQGGKPADVRFNAGNLIRLADQHCHGLPAKRCCDPAGDAQAGFARTILGEYESAGLSFTQRWHKPPGSVPDGIQLIEAFLNPAAGPVALVVHPRCEATIEALESFHRKKLRAEYLDEPEDPQHPAEDMVEALRGGLRLAFPLGRQQLPGLRPIHPGRLHG